MNLSYDQLMDFVIDEVYEPYDVIPVRCVLSGSRTYGMSTEESDYDFVGTHIMNTWECLEHPDFRKKFQVIRESFIEEDDLLITVPPGEKGGDVSLDSFEMWKHITLWLKGSFVAYEILHQPPIHESPDSVNLTEIMRAGVTNRFGKAAKGNVFHNWRKAKNSRKRTVMAYYRLIQAIFLLREGEFVWLVDDLLEYNYTKDLINIGKYIIELYKNPETRTQTLTSVEVDNVSKELSVLIEEVERAIVFTKLPDQVPRDILDAVLQKVKRTRSLMI